MSAPVCTLLRAAAPTLSVGATSANLMALAGDIATLEACGATLLHFDSMDGHFAPQLTVGPAFVKSVQTAMLKDVHLMIENPFDVLPQYAAAGADIITVHVESCVHARACLQRIGGLPNVRDESRGIGRGIALNPGTPLSALEPLLDEADIVTLVAINPGFGGQTLYPDTARRAAQVRGMIMEAGRDILLCIDGGITKATIGAVAAMKPDIVVSGSAVFEKNAIRTNFDAMTASLKGIR
jgi:ribulose-phosphate 3-epimerase